MQKFDCDPNTLPLVTIGILSWNRLHYLKATVESAYRCIQYPRIEWIISDNISVEPGLRDYIEGLEWIDHKVFRRQSHADAMNEIVQMARGDLVLLWPDDMQFTVEGDWLVDVVELLIANPDLGTVHLNYLRTSTNRALFTWRAWLKWKAIALELRRFGPRFRRQRVLRSSRGLRMRTYGWVWPGVVGSGIPSITRTDTWRQLGPWKTTQQSEDKRLIDSSLGAEEDMVNRFFASGLVLQQAVPIVPVAADIVTDPTGTKAKVRGDKRYGVYFPPPHGHFYYRISPAIRFVKEMSRRIPLSFEEWVEPLGFALPFDGNGNMLKAGLNTSVTTEL
jgi:glycosyltransferase involved in cell wall biosynthesis